MKIKACYKLEEKEKEKNLNYFFTYDNRMIELKENYDKEDN
ncbi:MAG: hypothetical protein ACTSQG_00250 [Promethearchaeota archaeon]